LVTSGSSGKSHQTMAEDRKEKLNNKKGAHFMSAFFYEKPTN